MLSWIRRRLAKSDEAAVATLNGAAHVAEAEAKPAPAPVEIPHDKIAARAAEIWDRKGRPHGQDVQNWMEAEAELRAEFAANPDSEPLPRKPR